MKVLIVNTFYEGTSTGKIATGMYNMLKKHGHECKFIYGVGKANSNPDFIKVDNNIDIKISWFANQITGIHGAFAPFVMLRIKRILEDFKPDVIQLYNLHYYYLDIYMLFELISKYNIPIVYGMLDEYPYLGYCCYAYDCDKFKNACRECNYQQFRKVYPRNLFRNGSERTIHLKEQAYNRCSKLVFTAPSWVAERAKQSYLLKGRDIRVVDEYVDNFNTFIPYNTDKLRDELQIPKNNLVIIDVAPSDDPRKGVDYFISVANMMRGLDITFINVGFRGDVSKLPPNLIPIGFVKDQKLLAQYYSLADLFVCTSMADTMPNSCLDSLSCGTPIVGFDITGIPYVADEPIGTFVSPGNLEELQKVICNTKKKDEFIINQCREYALKRYSPDVYYNNVVKIYEEVVEER